MVCQASEGESGLIRLILLFLLLPLHLGTRDRRKSRRGSHIQKTHGSWSPNNPFYGRAMRGRKLLAARVGGLVFATDDDRKRLRIPPAWTDVRVNREEGAALLAVGRDAKGREQRIYSARHHENQAAAKFARIKELHDRLPEIDKRISGDAKTDDTAMAALLIRRMGLRPGSDVDTKAEKKAFGATNLRAGHITVKGDTVNARFTGKKGVELDLSLEDAELAKLLDNRKRGKAPDDRLLNTDERALRTYISKVAPGVKPKDLRTYLGTALATQLVSEVPMPKNKKEYKAQRRKVAQRVAQVLGNTPTIALSSYIAPAAFGPWESVNVV